MKYEVTKTFTFEGRRYVVRAHTEEEAIEKKVNKLRDLEEGKVTIGGGMLVSKWVSRCLDVYKPNISYEYRRQMEWRIGKYILSRIGNMQMKSVKPLMCQEILNSMSGMSKSHITKVHQELCFIFDKAVENHIILESPAAHLIRPTGYENTRRSLTEKERIHFLKVCDTDPRYNLFLLMLYCGCRPAEAMGVQGMDITMVDDLRCLHIRGTKTKKSDRMVPLPDILYQKIKDVGPFDYVATNTEGNKYTDASYRKAVNSLKREINLSMGCRVYRNQLVPPFPLSEDFTPYILRHTYCTDLQKMGVDLRAASALMGHSNIQTTANIYTHQDNETLKQAAKCMFEKMGVTPDAERRLNA